MIAAHLPSIASIAAVRNTASVSLVGDVAASSSVYTLCFLPSASTSLDLTCHFCVSETLGMSVPPDTLEMSVPWNPWFNSGQGVQLIYFCSDCLDTVQSNTLSPRFNEI